MFEVWRACAASWKAVRIFVGKPLDLSDRLSRPKPHDAEEEMGMYRDIADTVIHAIKSIAPECREEEGGEPA